MTLMIMDINSHEMTASSGGRLKYTLKRLASGYAYLSLEPESTETSVSLMRDIVATCVCIVYFVLSCVLDAFSLERYPS
jgi:hypothetical protein